jgi:hypothetical protein
MQIAIKEHMVASVKWIGPDGHKRGWRFGLRGEKIPTCTYIINVRGALYVFNQGLKRMRPAVDGEQLGTQMISYTRCYVRGGEYVVLFTEELRSNHTTYAIRGKFRHADDWAIVDKHIYIVGESWSRVWYIDRICDVHRCGMDPAGTIRMGITKCDHVPHLIIPLWIDIGGEKVYDPEYCDTNSEDILLFMVSLENGDAACGYCIRRERVIWVHQMQRGSTWSYVQYIADNVIQTWYGHDNRTRYYNVTDGTSYDIM